MVRLARAALFTVVPVELLVLTLAATGASLPSTLVVATEMAVVALFVLEAVVAHRLFRRARRGGADRRAALRATVDRLVPVQVRRIMDFDLKGMVSLVQWATRHRNGVPPGAAVLPYARAQVPMLMVFLFVMVVEVVCLELLLRGIGAPARLRTGVLVVDLYSVLFGLQFAAACVTRPHVVSADELRIRFGVFFDLRVPRRRIRAVRLAPNYNEAGMVKTYDERLAVAVTAQTNVVVELTEPITVVRPLGRRAEARTIRFFTDAPNTALDALRPLRQPA